MLCVLVTDKPGWSRQKVSARWTDWGRWRKAALDAGLPFNRWVQNSLSRAADLEDSLRAMELLDERAKLDRVRSGRG